MHLNLDAFEQMAARCTDKTIAVAAAHDLSVLEAIQAAHERFGISARLYGDVVAMRTLSPRLAELKGIILLDSPDDETSAKLAVADCRNGQADILMKGQMHTATLLRAVVDREKGLREEGLFSHVMFYEPPNYGKLLALTDGGINTFPDLSAKKIILRNALLLLRRLGYTQINAAVIAGAEDVNPKIQSTVDAAELMGMPEWRDLNARVIGPVGLDLAISPAAAATKHYKGEGAGEADLLLVPTYEVGNGIGKCLTWFAGAESAGIIVGAKVPIVLVSRSDDDRAKRRSIALALAALGNDTEDI